MNGSNEPKFYCTDSRNATLARLGAGEQLAGGSWLAAQFRWPLARCYYGAACGDPPFVL
jgi:hypothetical protein